MGDLVSGFIDQYGKKLLYAFVAYMLFRVVLWVWPLPQPYVEMKTPPPPKEGFEPRDETNESWVRL
jgi:hypothetical protein